MNYEAVVERATTLLATGARACRHIEHDRVAEDGQECQLYPRCAAVAIAMGEAELCLRVLREHNNRPPSCGQGSFGNNTAIVTAAKCEVLNDVIQRMAAEIVAADVAYRRPVERSLPLALGTYRVGGRMMTIYL